MFLSYKVKTSECEMACIIVTDIWKQELKMKEQRTRNYINYFLFPFISFKFCLLFVKFLKSFPAPPKEDSAITLKEFVCGGVHVCSDGYSTAEASGTKGGLGAGNRRLAGKP